MNMNMPFNGHGYPGPRPFPPPPHSLPMRPIRPHTSNITHDRPPAAVQDPLSDAPTQTYQGYQIQRHELPAKPTVTASSSTSTSAAQPHADSAGSASPAPAAAIISAEPQLRDLRKEATSFVPRGIKRKNQQLPGGVSVNSAPGAGDVDVDGDLVRAKRTNGGGLMSKLHGVLGDMKQSHGGLGGTAKRTGTEVNEDDYQKFLAGLGSLDDA
jgi:hypothetical protein